MGKSTQVNVNHLSNSFDNLTNTFANITSDYSKQAAAERQQLDRESEKAKNARRWDLQQAEKSDAKALELRKTDAMEAGNRFALDISEGRGPKLEERDHTAVSQKEFADMRKTWDAGESNYRSYLSGKTDDLDATMKTFKTPIGADKSKVDASIAYHRDSLYKVREAANAASTPEDKKAIIDKAVLDMYGERREALATTISEGSFLTNKQKVNAWARHMPEDFKRYHNVTGLKQSILSTMSGNTKEDYQRAETKRVAGINKAASDDYEAKLGIAKAKLKARNKGKDYKTLSKLKDWDIGGWVDIDNTAKSRIIDKMVAKGIPHDQIDYAVRGLTSSNFIGTSIPAADSDEVTKAIDVITSQMKKDKIPGMSEEIVFPKKYVVEQERDLQGIQSYKFRTSLGQAASNIQRLKIWDKYKEKVTTGVNGKTEAIADNIPNYVGQQAASVISGKEPGSVVDRNILAPAVEVAGNTSMIDENGNFNPSSSDVNSVLNQRTHNTVSPSGAPYLGSLDPNGVKKHPVSTTTSKFISGADRLGDYINSVGKNIDSAVLEYENKKLKEFNNTRDIVQISARKSREAFNAANAVRLEEEEKSENNIMQQYVSGGETFGTNSERKVILSRAGIPQSLAHKAANTPDKLSEEEKSTVVSALGGTYRQQPKVSSTSVLSTNRAEPKKDSVASYIHRDVGSTGNRLPQVNLTPTMEKAAGATSYTAMMEHAESSGRSNATNGQYLGKFQMGNAALIDSGYKNHKGDWTGKNGVNSKEDYLRNDDAQYDSFNSLTNRNATSLNNTGAMDFVGKTFKGIRITTKGLMAAAHLVGATAVARMLKTGVVPKDGNGTSALEYLKMGSTN